MISQRLDFQPELPEWRRSGRFVLIALFLHAVVLFSPLQVAIGKLEIPEPKTIMVRLVETVSAPPAKPQIVPPQPLPSNPAASPRERVKPTPHPVLAMSPEPSAPPAAFAVPEAVAAPAAPPAPAVVASNAPVAVTTARFDAAYLQNPRPNYPPLSRRLGEEGKVLLKVRVSPNGQPTVVELERSSSFERLDEAARQTVARWRFVPAKRGEEAVEASVIVPIVFRLES